MGIAPGGRVPKGTSTAKAPPRATPTYASAAAHNNGARYTPRQPRVRVVEPPARLAARVPPIKPTAETLQALPSTATAV